LRIRDLGGLVVIDFIDMESSRHQREVEEKLRNALKLDRARVQLGRISRFGLMELSRQRLRPSLEESTQIVCPRCDGHGRIRGIESLSLSALRLIEEHAMKEHTGQVLVQAPARVANFLLNEKRSSVVEIELRHKVHVVIVADENLETPHLEITRIRESEMGEHAKPSYERLTDVAATPQPRMGVVVHGEEPAVSGIQRAMPMPQREEVAPAATPAPAAASAPVAASPATASGGLLGRLFGWFRNPPAPEVTLSERTEPKRATETADAPRRERSSERRSDASRNGGRRNGHDRDGDARRPRQGSQTSKSSQSRSGKSRGDDSQRPARPAQKPVVPAAKPAVEPHAHEAMPAHGEATATVPHHDTSHPVPAKPASAPGAEAEAAKPADNTAHGAEAPATPAAADAAGTGKRRRGRRGGRRRKHASATGQSDAAPAMPHDIDDEDADRGAGTPHSAEPTAPHGESPRLPETAQVAKHATPAAAPPAPVTHEQAPATAPLFAVSEQKPAIPAPSAPASRPIAATAPSDNVPRPTTPPMAASTPVVPTSVTPSPVAPRAPEPPHAAAAAAAKPAPPPVSPAPAAAPVTPAAPKPEPVTPSLFAAPPTLRPIAQSLPRHPAIPTPRPLSGAIRPILAPSVLPPKAPAAPAAPTPEPDKPQE
jgi:ribonuclease E